MKHVVVVIVIALLLALAPSCRTVYVPVEKEHTDSVIIRQRELVEVQVRDSIYVEKNADTVRIERWRTRWRDRLRVDTVYIERTLREEIPVPTESRGASALRYVFLSLVGVCILFFISRIWK